MSDVSRPQTGEPAPGAGSSATAAGQGAQTPARPISPDAATGWAILVFVLAQVISTAVVWIWYAGDLPISPTSKSYDGTLIALLTLTTNPVLVVLFWRVVRYYGLDAREYLALTRFSWRDF